MASHQRTPRDIRQMVTESQNDMDDIQENLAKLKALKADDKSEAARLRSRVDEQSRLIMILKQRADDEILRAQSLDRVNKELAEFRDQAQHTIRSEVKKFTQLEERFNCLASNHEEMIKIKNEYKRGNMDLREENEKLKTENARLFSTAIQERDIRIAELEKKFVAIKQENMEMSGKFRQMQHQWREREESLREQLKQVTESSAAQLKEATHKAAQAEERLKGLSNRLQNVEESRRQQEVQTGSQVEALSRERDDLLDTVMQRGKLVQKEQTENKRLVKKIEETEKQMRTLKEEFEREADSVNANLQVRKLKNELDRTSAKYTEMEKEFAAFKKHSNNLLKQEKDLNERLRHLAE